MEILQHVKEFFRRLGRKDPSTKFKAELERVTDRLIEETVGDDGEITQEFKRRMEEYDPGENPISPKEAEALIHSLIRTAVAQRKCLTERIATSVENGELYAKYYGKIHLISDSAVEAYTKLQLLERSREEFEYYEEMYNNIREKAFDSSVKPVPKQPKPKKTKDILIAIDEAGGEKP